MVQVAHSAPVLAGVVVVAQRVAVLGGPGERGTAVIVAADVGRLELIGHALVGLGGEIDPVRDILAVVDHDVGNGADALALEGVDHRAQLRLVTERTVVVGEPVQVIIAHRRATTIGALGHPHQGEELSQLIGLGLQTRPAAVAVTVPIETLQHHAAVVCRPSLGQHHQRQQHNKCGSQNLFHCSIVFCVGYNVLLIYANIAIYPQCQPLTRNICKKKSHAIVCRARIPLSWR